LEEGGGNWRTRTRIGNEKAVVAVAAAVVMAVVAEMAVVAVVAMAVGS
jgi:hypothetical protein